MPTPSGNIGLSDVNIELRKTSSTNTGLGDADVRALARVPSGNIGLNDLRNKSILSLGDQAVSASASGFGFAQAQAQISFNSNGTITCGSGNVLNGIFNGTSSWSIITPSGLSTSGGGYEMRLFNSSVSEGTISGPGGWSPSNEILQDIGSGLTWTFTVTNPGSGANPAFGSFNANILIREKANVNVFVGASLSMTASATDSSRPLQ